MSNVFAKKRCLILNKNWLPIGTIGLQDAILKLFSTYSNGEPKALVVDPESYQTFSWDDWSKVVPSNDSEVITSASLKMLIPEIIVLTKYDKMPKTKMYFSRRNLYKRDKFSCQYCGKRPGSSELTIDHIIPKSKGGETSWENCVLCCVECNRDKGDKTLKECGMKLKKIPKKPQGKFFHLGPRPCKSWKQFLSEAYWTVELEE